MKKYALMVASGLLLSALLLARVVSAQNTSSGNFTLIEPEIQSYGGEVDSANYKHLGQISEIIGDQLSSSLYKTGLGHGYVFMANVPTVQCFETTTVGSSSCSNLPHAKGMVEECGQGGCYDRAKIEINAQNNPSDTVYLIEISPDNWTTTYIVDGITHNLKLASLKAITDYKTKTSWETGAYDAYNVFNLRSGVVYKTRIKALHGNFTESGAGPEASATTAVPTLMFDLDTGTTIASSNNAPYVINMGTIVPGSPLEATDRIWVTFGTNATNGGVVFVRDQYTGLRSASTLYTLASANEDLAIPASDDGFGLKSGTTQNDTTAVGYLRVGSQYNTANPQQVGRVISLGSFALLCSVKNIGDTCEAGTGSPLKDGRAEVKVLARASFSAPAVNDYTDNVIFTLLGTW